ncbi:helix-turn-helix domain-containing protein [Myroides sp. LJL116]
MSNISDINILSDKVILSKIGLFVQQDRIKQDISQQELAEKSALSRSTVSLLERGEGISLLNLIKILRMLDALYILKQFEEREEISPLRLAKGKKNLPKRVKKKEKVEDYNTDLGW